MRSRASCIRARACTSSAAVGPGTSDRLDVADGQVGPGQDDRTGRPNGPGRSAGPPAQSPPEDSRLCSAAPDPDSHEVRVLAFIDDIVIPFLNSLYGAVGYVGVHAGDGHRIGDGPAALRADPAVRRLPRVRPEPDRAADRAALELLDRGRSWRPSATRSGRSSPTRSGRTGAGRSSSATASTCSSDRTRSSWPTRSSPGTAPRPCSSAGCCRSCGPSSASRPASPGCRSSPFIIFSTAGAFIWSCLLVYAGTVLGRELGADPAHASSRSTWPSRSSVVLAVVLFIWWRLGTPGRPGRGEDAGDDADRLRPTA